MLYVNTSLVYMYMLIPPFCTYAKYISLKYVLCGKDVGINKIKTKETIYIYEIIHKRTANGWIRFF